MTADLVVIAKSDAHRRRDAASGAATGAGVAGVGAGLAGGGIPGTKADRITVDIARAPWARKPEMAWRARRAGAFGYRTNAHSTFLNFSLSPQAAAARHPGSSKRARFSRAMIAGKRAPEERIITHLKLGRKASHGLLAGGAALTAAGLAAKRRNVDVDKADSDRRNAELVAGGGAAAAGGYGAARLLENQGRSWSTRSAADIAAAHRIAPRTGSATIRVTRSAPKVPDVAPEVSNYEIKTKARKVLARKSGKQVEAVGRLRGDAANARYFAHVYGMMGNLGRKVIVPAGLATAALGAARSARNPRRDAVAKASTELTDSASVGRWISYNNRVDERPRLPKKIRPKVVLTRAVKTGR